MTVRIVLTVASDDVIDAVQQVLFAVQETWGETEARKIIQASGQQQP